MGTVSSITDALAERERRFGEVAMAARMHPALRWYAGADRRMAHRRTPLSRAVCGRFGQLSLAHRDTQLCPDCYPWAGRPCSDAG